MTLPEEYISFILPIVSESVLYTRQLKTSIPLCEIPPGSPRLLASSRKLLCRLRRTRQPLLCRSPFYYFLALWFLLLFSIEFKTRALENFMAEFLGAFWFLKLNSRRRVVLLPLSFEITFLGGSPAPDSSTCSWRRRGATRSPTRLVITPRHTIVNLMRVRSL